MLIYIIVFSVAIVSIKKAQINKEKNAAGYIRYIVLSAAVLILLAALRGRGVGTDTSGYQTKLFYLAQRYNSLQMFLKVSTQEPLYSILTYISSRTGLLWICHLVNISIVIIPLYVVIWSERQDISPELSLAVFLFLFYGWSLNGMRQAMAMSISMLALYYYADGKRKLSVVLMIIGTGLHYSAVIGIIIIALYVMTNSSLKRIYIIAITVVAILGTVLYRPILRLAVRVIPFFKASYASEQALFSGGFDFDMTIILMCFLGVVALVLTGGVESSCFLKYDFLRAIMMVLIVSVFIGGNLGYANRVFKFFDRYLIFIIPRYEYLIKKNISSLIIWKAVFYGFLLVYWLLLYVYRGRNEIIPYYPYWDD